MRPLAKLGKDRPRAQSPSSAAAGLDADLLPLAILLWVGSAVRVGYALLHHEVFRTEATLALACMALIPWLLVVTRRRYRPSSSAFEPADWATRSHSGAVPGRVILLRIPADKAANGYRPSTRPKGCSTPRVADMNVAFFLTPKSETVWVRPNGTVADALERMRPHRYGAVPMLDDDGRYVGTLTEGDILRHLLGSGSAAPDPAGLKTPLH